MIRRYLHPHFLLVIRTLLYSRLSGIVFYDQMLSFSVFVCFSFDACPIRRSFPLGHARGPCCHLVFLVPYLKGSEGFRLNFRRMLFLYPYREENRGFRSFSIFYFHSQQRKNNRFGLDVYLNEYGLFRCILAIY